jgi:hypothetical protein
MVGRARRAVEDPRFQIVSFLFLSHPPDIEARSKNHCEQEEHRDQHYE